MDTTTDLAVGRIVMELLGGLALFLFGMGQMTDALKLVAGESMRKALGKLTKNRFTAALTGAGVTAIIQSSSVTTVLVVGFISAGLMTLPQSVGIIMGAKVGSTVTAQIIAFNVTQYALLLVTIGFALLFAVKKEKARLYGAMVMGLGLIFFGMGLMSDATRPLRTFQPFIEIMTNMSNPFLGLLVGAAFTALVQSSSATTGIVIVLASQGFISLEAGIALAMGANIGTCVTAVLAALGKPRTAVQAAAVHVSVAVIGVSLWMPFIPQLAEFARDVSPATPELEGTARLAAETPRQIANAFTFFNVGNTFILIWFTGLIASLVMKLLPEKPEVIPEHLQPQYLDAASLETPAIALDRIRLELVRYGRLVQDVFAGMRPAITTGTREDLQRVVDEEKQTEYLYEAIVSYTRRLAQTEIDEAHSPLMSSLGAVANQIQHVGETMAVNMVDIGRQRLEQGLAFSDETLTAFEPLAAKVRESFDLAIEALEQADAAKAHQVAASKPGVQLLADGIRQHLDTRLLSDDPNRIPLYRLQNDVLALVVRVHTFARKIAKEILRHTESDEAGSALADDAVV